MGYKNVLFDIKNDTCLSNKTIKNKIKTELLDEWKNF